MTHKITIAILTLLAFTAPCVAEFPEKGVISVSPNKQYAIWSHQPWYSYPLNLFAYATGRIPRFSKASLIDIKGQKVFRHVEPVGNWSDDSECYGGRKSDNHVVLYFPAVKRKIEPESYIWAKGKDDIYLINFAGLGPANSSLWLSENSKDREIHFSRISLSNPIPHPIGNFTIPINTEAIVCTKSCGNYIRFGYSYSIHKNANPIVINDPNSSTFVSGRIALHDFNISNGKTTQAHVIKTTPEMSRACDCPGNQ